MDSGFSFRASRIPLTYTSSSLDSPELRYLLSRLKWVNTALPLVVAEDVVLRVSNQKFPTSEPVSTSVLWPDYGTAREGIWPPDAAGPSHVKPKYMVSLVPALNQVDYGRSRQVVRGRPLPSSLLSSPQLGVLTYWLHYGNVFVSSSGAKTKLWLWIKSEEESPKIVGHSHHMQVSR